jgi:hypothetical protein
MTIVGTPSSAPPSLLLGSPRLRLSRSGASLGGEDGRSASGSARLVARASLESSSELRLNSCQNEGVLRPCAPTQPCCTLSKSALKNRRKVEDRRGTSATRSAGAGLPAKHERYENASTNFQHKPIQFFPISPLLFAGSRRASDSRVAGAFAAALLLLVSAAGTHRSRAANFSVACRLRSRCAWSPSRL